MTATIKVDYREKALISVGGSAMDVCNLSVGDVLICDGESDVPLLLAERKTWSDLGASIKDGRFRQQKERLLEASGGDPSKVLFIVEGSKRSIKVSDVRMVDGAILNLMFKHSMKVVYTADPEETWRMVSLIKDKLDNRQNGDGVSVPVNIKSKSRGDKINEHILATQLSVIPGISFNMGLKISDVYGTMSELILAYDKLGTEGERELMLASIDLNGRRSVGKATSAKVYRALHCRF